MKKVILMLVVALSVVTASAQIELGVNGGILSPTGDFGKAYKTAFGGGISGEYLVAPSIGIGLSVGYYSFKDKGGDTNLGFIPVALNGRYYFINEGSIKPYGQLDLGLYTFRTPAYTEDFGMGTIDIAASSTSKFGLAPVIGIQFGLSNALALDINVKYNHIFTDGSATGMLGANIGLIFTIGK